MLEEVEGIEQICVEFHHRFYSDGENTFEKYIRLPYNHMVMFLVNTSKSKKEMTFFKRSMSILGRS